MDYKKIYDNLVNTRLSRGLDKSKLTGYYEKHHIVPRCLEGTDDESNFVLLSYKEHLLAHRLLSEIYPESKKIKLALVLMSTVEIDENGTKSRKELSLREFSRIRELSSEANTGRRVTDESRLKMSLAKSGENNPIFGTHRSEETKNKISKANKGTKPFSFGKHLSEEHRRHISESSLGRPGIKPTEESNRKRSESLKKNENIKRGHWKGKELSESHKRNISNNRPNKKSVSGPNGKVWDSIAAAAKDLGVSKTTVSYWIKNFPEKGFRFI